MAQIIRTARRRQVAAAHPLYCTFIQYSQRIGTMYGKVKRLRRHGKRLNDREISRSEPVEGEITLSGHSWTMEYVLTLRRPNDNASAPLMQLHDARLIVMHGDGMLFKGIERPAGDDGPAFVQEWSVRLEML